MDYVSDIRPSDLTDLRERVRQQKFEKYLLSIKFEHIRAIKDQRVSFDFPVTALIGPNGGGKSTVLGASALAYQDITPRTFFAKSHIGDDSMQDWRVDYDLIDRSVLNAGPINRNSKFHNKKWVRENAPRREVRIFGISRTVPATEKSIFQRMVKSTFTVHGGLHDIPADVADKVAMILGKSVERYQRGGLTDRENFYLGSSAAGNYSELHFGAGEASVLRMVHELEGLPNSSLVLIEELENGLHPIAVAKMLEYLVDLSLRKKLQVIFTTHSDIAIQPLPREAVWASVDGKLQQGKLSVEATRAISGRIDRKLSIFTEDAFAELWVRISLNRCLGEDSRQVGIFGLTGESVAVATHRSHVENPAVESLSVCILDGDSSFPEDMSEGIYKLPGGQPENYIFSFAADDIENSAGLLSAYCQFDPTRQDHFKDSIAKVRTTTEDPHLYFSKLGMELGFISEDVVRRAFISYWCDKSPHELKRLSDFAKAKLTEAERG